MKETSASSTALTIAAAMAYLARTGGGVPGEARILSDWLLTQHSPLTRFLLGSFDHAWGRGLVRGLETATVPGIVAHYLARKLALEALVRERADVRQSAVLGAGFDTLALRLAAEDPGRQVWEVDHPATQAWKIRALAACGLERPNLRFLARDFSRPEGRSLFEPGREHETFWIAEGLLMYFPAVMVKEFFRGIHRVSKPGSRLAFTFLEPGKNGLVDFRRRSLPLRLWLKSQSEPFQWGIRREKLPQFLAGLGFRSLAISSEVTAEMDRLDVGEYLALAEVETL